MDNSEKLSLFRKGKSNSVGLVDVPCKEIGNIDFVDINEGNNEDIQANKMIAIYHSGSNPFTGWYICVSHEGGCHWNPRLRRGDFNETKGFNTPT